MRKMFTYMRRYWFIALLAPITMIADVFIDLQLPKLMSVIVDEGVLKGQLDIVIKTGIMMILLSVLGGISGILAAAFSAIASQNFGNDVRCDTYRRVMSLSPEQTDKFTTGSLVTRITNDIQQVQMFMNFLLRMFVRSPMFFAGGIIMMLGLNLSFATVVAISLPIMLIGVVLIVIKTNPMFKVVQEKLDKLISVVMENVTGARVVKAYVREEHETKGFGNANDDLCSTNLRVHFILALMNPI